MSESQKRTRKGWVLPASVASVALIASLAAGTLGAYSAQITNDGNTAGTGKLTMSESEIVDGQPTKTQDTASGNNNTIAVSDINKYGGNMKMVPGDSQTTTVQFKNTGSVDASAFTLNFGDCTATGKNESANSLCDALQVTVTSGDQTLANQQSPSALSGQTINIESPMKVDATKDFEITVTLPEGTTDTSLMGQQISQNLVWTLSA
ncbi:hypothetical protein ACUY26_03170 [Corynebacterium segmentosum]|uniref:hypothetical protein n=1 Tax=Corynebacterium accolens TaxID=38284 RepID=UPI0002E50F49|nr:hypothetical protein [Corynebacterium accolens]MDK8470651.1 hypothetical protein [Corynebacterium accolens]MDK8505208.1 hypothetical protein [Corynebacterium accolens]MDK8616732.1 hypothetical protein [Corynebacterium accolens]MDK8661991.1 hypothetical protein [Corynebacterium accolens]UQZ28527.1 hypothetical protein CACC_09205 [Corynebacterium accolens]